MRNFVMVAPEIGVIWWGVGMAVAPETGHLYIFTIRFFFYFFYFSFCYWKCGLGAVQMAQAIETSQKTSAAR